jgi:hypothetical protein
MLRAATRATSEVAISPRKMYAALAAAIASTAAPAAQAFAFIALSLEKRALA